MKNTFEAIVKTRNRITVPRALAEEVFGTSFEECYAASSRGKKTYIFPCSLAKDVLKKTPDVSLTKTDVYLRAKVNAEVGKVVKLSISQVNEVDVIKAEWR